MFDVRAETVRPPAAAERVIGIIGVNRYRALQCAWLAIPKALIRASPSGVRSALWASESRLVK